MKFKSILFSGIILIILIVGISFFHPLFQVSKPQFSGFKGSADYIDFTGQNSTIQFKTTGIYFYTNVIIFYSPKNITIESNKGEMKLNYSSSIEIQTNKNISQNLFNNIDADMSFENLTMNKPLGGNNINLDGYLNYINLKLNSKEVITLQRPLVEDVSIGGQKLMDYYGISFEMDNTSSIVIIPGKFKSQVYNVSNLKITSQLSKITLYQGEGIFGLDDHEFDVKSNDLLGIEIYPEYSILTIDSTKLSFIGNAKSAKLNNEDIIMNEVSYWFKIKPESLFSGINAFAVVILVILTGWYAYSTRLMLDEQRSTSYEQTKNRKIDAIEKKLEKVYSPINNAIVEFNYKLQSFPNDKIPDIYDEAFKELHSELLEINRNYNHLLDEDIRIHYRKVYNSWLKYSSDKSLANYNILNSFIFKFHKLIDSKIKEGTKLLEDLQS